MSDLIERQVALDGIKEYLEEYSGTDQNGLHDPKWCAMKEAEMLIKDLPSAQSERKKGKWIKQDTGAWSCDQCSSWIPDEQHYYANYCLYCGAYMRGDSDGSD